MDAVGIAIIICVVVGLVIAAVVGVIAFMAGSSHRKKSAEATIGSAEEEAKKIIEEAVKTAEAKKKEAVLEGIRKRTCRTTQRSTASGTTHSTKRRISR